MSSNTRTMAALMGAAAACVVVRDGARVFVAPNVAAPEEFAAVSVQALRGATVEPSTSSSSMPLTALSVAVVGATAVKMISRRRSTQSRAHAVACQAAGALTARLSWSRRRGVPRQIPMAVPGVLRESHVALKAVAGISIAGTGSATPSTIVTNDDLSKIVDTNDEWIVQRTGIRQRHILGTNESLVSIAHQAAAKALESANMQASEVQLVILATSSPDDLFGSAPELAAKLGATNAVAFDLTAACSGFVFALVTAAQYIRSGAFSSVLVVGADCLSRWVDWTDRGVCVLFGDGAGAVALRATSPDKDALLAYDLGSDGAGRCHLNCSGENTPVSLGSGKEGGNAKFKLMEMNGKEVFRFATSRVPELLSRLLERNGYTGEQVDWLLLHQANKRIMDAAAKRLNLPQEKIICNLDEYGNTSAASIPLALDEAVRAGAVKPGQLLACAGFGAGLSWGGMLLRL